MQAPVLSANVQKRQKWHNASSVHIEPNTHINNNVLALLKPKLTHKDLHSTAYPFMPQVKDLYMS